jgi:hypothetical protein
MQKIAVERILGLLVKPLTKKITRYNLYTEKISNAKAIIGLRNQVIHA